MHPPIAPLLALCLLLPEALSARPLLFEHPHTPARHSSRVVLDPSQIDVENDVLSLVLDGTRLRAEQEHAAVLADGATSWSGQLYSTRGDQAGHIDLVRSARGVTGSLQHGERLHHITALGQGQHLLQEIDRAALPALHPAPLRTGGVGVADGRAAAAPAAASSTIRVLVVATDASVAAYRGDLRALAEVAIAEANRSYRDSGLSLHLKLGAYRSTDFEETGWPERDLLSFAGVDDGAMDEIHPARDHSGSDVAVLILSRSFACGQAAARPALADSAFAYVALPCLSGDNVLAHEIGHLMGADHDAARSDAPEAYPFAHGYWHQPAGSAGWRTVMSYDCPTGCRRIPLWSSPVLTHDGSPAGNAASADNRRVLELQRERVAAFRETPAEPVSP